MHRERGAHAAADSLGAAECLRLGKPTGPTDRGGEARGEFRPTASARRTSTQDSHAGLRGTGASGREAWEGLWRALRGSPDLKGFRASRGGVGSGWNVSLENTREHIHSASSWFRVLKLVCGRHRSLRRAHHRPMRNPRNDGLVQRFQGGSHVSWAILRPVRQ